MAQKGILEMEELDSLDNDRTLVYRKLKPDWKEKMQEWM